MSGVAIGVDIGGTHLRAGRVDASGGLGPVVRAPSSADPETVLARCLALIGELGGAGGTAAIGVGVPGQVDPERGILSGGFVNLSGVDVAARVAAATGLPVTIENDATMALIAEAACGAAKGLREAVLLTIGTGIGGGVLSGGRVLRGRGTAGQLGHVTVDAAGLVCVCGRRGCVETTSSGTAFGRLAAAAGLPAGTRVDDLLARRGDDPAAARLLAEWAGPLRVAIDTLAAAFAPEAVLLGGGLGRAAAAALEAIPSPSSWFEAPVRAAALGDDAGVIGAGLAALGAPPRARTKRAVLVNGVPASGKSAVARALSDATGWPVLALDAVKDPFLTELGGADRAFNRSLGRASYAAIFGVLRAAPEGTVAIVDAWFGFQPPEVLERHLADAGVAATAEIWCHAPPETLVARYTARVGRRAAGHPGLDYAVELAALAARAEPLRRGPVLALDTTAPLEIGPVAAWLGGLWPDARRGDGRATGPE